MHGCRVVVILFFLGSYKVGQSQSNISAQRPTYTVSLELKTTIQVHPAATASVQCLGARRWPSRRCSRQSREGSDKRGFRSTADKLTYCPTEACTIGRSKAEAVHCSHAVGFGFNYDVALCGAGNSEASRTFCLSGSLLLAIETHAVELFPSSLQDALTAGPKATH